MIALVTGGQSSGKSAFALERTLAAPGPHRFIATGKALDAEFSGRITAHRAERPAWMPVDEVDVALGPALAEALSEGGTVLVDSLDFWLFSCLSRKADHEPQRFFAALDRLGSGSVVLVSSEVGLCPVPSDSLTRRFVRELGELNRRVAAVADAAYLVAAGLPLTLKQD